MSDYLNRKEKSEAREYVFAGLKPARSLLAIPGAEAVCVEKMVKMGIIGTDTRHVWFEKNPDRFHRLIDRADELGLHADIRNTDIREYTPTADFDLVNLDFEESFSWEIGQWIEGKLAPALKPGSTVLFTFTHTRNRFIMNFHRWFDTVVKSDPVLSVQRQKILENLNHYDASAVRSILLVACALSRFAIHVDAIRYYCDRRSPMTVFRCNVGDDKVTNIPSFSMLRSKYGGRADTQSVIDLSKIGETSTMSIEYEARGKLAAATRKRNKAEELLQASNKLATEAAELINAAASLEAEAQSIRSCEESRKSTRRQAAIKAWATRRSKSSQQHVN